MALFKSLRGKRENLPSTKTDGYAYFCTDDGTFWIDYKDDSDVVQRKQINAKDAETLMGCSISQAVNNSESEIPISSAIFNALAEKVPIARKVNGKALNTDIELSAEDVGAISYNEVQSLTDEQKTQARENIGAGAPQVQTDWNQEDTSAIDYIKNKPTIPTKTSDITNDSGFLTSHQDISSKLDITGDGSNVTAAFTAASTRANISTGEKLSVLFGKISKWFADLGSLAFKNTVAKSDLASDVQTSLGKADTALQSYTETDPTVPAWAKAEAKPIYTAAEVGALPADTVIPSAYTLPVATDSVLGGIKSGGDITIASDGTVTVTKESLPTYSAADNGKVLMIVNGIPTWVTLNLTMDSDGCIKI